MNRIFLMVLATIWLGLANDAMAQSREDADALYAESKWQEAAAAYKEVIKASPNDGAAWVGLGRSSQQLEQYEEAETAYLEGLAKGFQPAMVVHFNLARVYMLLDKRDQALAQLDSLAAVGGISHRALLAVQEFAVLADEPRFLEVLEILTPCNTEQYRQFDFWLGEWDVTPAGRPAPTAHNSITVAQDGCVVFEQYKTQGGFTGMSLNFYDSVTGLWHQTWMGNGGGAVYLEGGLENGAMVMTDANLAVSEVSGTINRVTWTLLDDGRVRQHWQSSQDKGETWTTAFDGYYERSQTTE